MGKSPSQSYFMIGDKSDRSPSKLVDSSGMTLSTGKKQAESSGNEHGRRALKQSQSATHIDRKVVQPQKIFGSQGQRSRMLRGADQQDSRGSRRQNDR